MEGYPICDCCICTYGYLDHPSIPNHIPKKIRKLVENRFGNVFSQDKNLRQAAVRYCLKLLQEFAKDNPQMTMRLKRLGQLPEDHA